MKNSYLHALISAENHKQANAILDALLEKKLVTGGPILQGPAKFWWKGEIVQMEYSYILTYTIEQHKQEIIEEIRRVSVEEVPMISFLPFEGNPELLGWIDSIVK